MVLLAGGRFRLGERGDTVTVAPVCLDVTEVTVDAYRRCAANDRCPPPAATEDFSGAGQPAGTEAHLCNGDKPGRGTHPMNCVSWEHATAYCQAQGKRLPTEEEWEWTARGGTRATPYPWGQGEVTDQTCWKHREGDKRLGTCPVGSHPRGDSPQGVKDLAGNVWEWTASSDRAEDGTACRVRRGGGWSTSSASRLDASVRFCDAPLQRQTDIGFRCAATPTARAGRL